MYNREAARYARWAAWAAALIVFIVAAVYAGARFARRALAGTRPHASGLCPTAVGQISFSKVEQDRTIFTIRASHATQYKDQNRSLLEDVWITIYGKDGSATTISTPANAATSRKPVRVAAKAKCRSTSEARSQLLATPPRDAASK